MSGIWPIITAGIGEADGHWADRIEWLGLADLKTVENVMKEPNSGLFIFLLTSVRVET